MKTLIKAEELLLTGLAFMLFLSLAYDWWWFWLLFLAPDLSMIGYLFGPRVGAWTYNLAHHRGLAVMLFAAGAYIQVAPLEAAGLIVLGHSSLDRALGYGLKYPDSFQHTHLGRIGRAAGRSEPAAPPG
ncbi:MAG: DUF4260 domain-containing protein [Anaerolineales bacterium]|nr:DUF4260 domain-containing protein [Anaerolineales bacterium]